MPKLKLFRTASGFHDSYVAAASRAAALRAWGARTDLFAMGAAEQVDDPVMLKRAAAKPGSVFQAKRGKGTEPAEVRAPKAKPKRKPSRAALDKAEQALRDLEHVQKEELDALDVQIAELRRRQEKLMASHNKARTKQVAALDRAREAYEGSTD